MITAASLAPGLGGALVAGGVAVAASRRRELMVRWCAWAVGVPLVTGAFWWGRPGAAAVALVVGVIAVAEFGGLMRMNRVDRAVLTAAVTGVVLTALLAPGQEARAMAIGALAVASAPLLAGDADHGPRRLGAGLLGLAWLGVLAALVPLGASALALFVAVSVADIVAYFAGRRLGGPRLSPLSPAKRWSGTLAGAAAGLGALAALSAFTPPMAVAVAVGGPAGDLLESMIKRGAQVKDAGRWLPGSGGLLDRIDSLLLALAVLLVLG
ncbi:phosphatidate cytidylyltransferase [Streptomyces sp. NBC_01218]|uniref:phosphatidate cytidylyltransferase n=1 Tax=unclassified Streptomyces TaxID=2593676 RepID=UPI0023B951A8|nr:MULTISPECIES: phosphatidate cytidylyltransferase [unclassified Streptomyces]WEH38713.1 phosphatidate cytidylyltransferase [Streptomyces sp. AM 2-1-1]WSQ50373.1 phosphatidate cytidylyltransferase [Streptomyces sp. NBC_01218]